MRTKLLIASYLLIGHTSSWAGSMMSGHVDLALEGGLAGGYFYSTNTGSSNNDNLLLSDGLVELVAANPIAETGNGYLGFGNLKMISILDGNGDAALGYRASYYESVNTPLQTNVTNPQTLSRIYVNRKYRNNVGIYYGVVELKPIDGLILEFGQLQTKVGLENPASFKNQHALLGALWHTQPNFYSGARLNVEFMEKNRLYLEINDDDTMDGDGAFAGGLVGEFDIAKYQLSYFDSSKGRNVVDVATSVKLPFVTVGLDFNYQKGDDDYLNLYSPNMPDSSAWGIATYVTGEFDNILLPLRIEYLKDNTSALYRVDYIVDSTVTTGAVATTATKTRGTNFENFDSMYTVTFSPTYRISEASFIRMEFAYVSAKNNIFRNADSFSNLKFDKFSTVLQAGYRF